MEKANSPKFSILMASYNNGKYIIDAIKSVLRQSYSNWELIIVDDASSDLSIEKIKSFVNNDSIKLYQHKKNLGCGQTKRDCAKFASGEIMGILDSDDVLHKDAIKIFLEQYTKNKHIGAIYSTYYECDSNLNVIRISPWVKGIKEGKTNLKKSYTSHFLTFKKSAYDKTEGFNKKQKKAVDKDIIYKLEEVTALLFIDRPLYYYRKHSTNISLDDNEQLASAYAIKAKYDSYKRRKKINIANYNNKEMSYLLFKGGVKFLYSHSLFNSIKFFLLSFKVYPMIFFIIIKKIIKNILLLY